MKSKTIVTPFRLVVVFIVLSLLSLFSLKSLIFQLNDTTNKNTLEISFSCSKTTPENTELSITSKIENTLSRIANINTISSFSAEDHGSIIVVFNSSTKIKDKRFEILLNLRQIYESLPRGTTFPIISHGGQQEVRPPMLSYSISGLENEEINSIRSLFEKNIRTKKAPVNVKITGAGKKTVLIEYDAKKLYSKNISINDLIAAIESYSNNYYIGTATNKDNIYFVKIDQDNSDLHAIEEIILSHSPLVKIKGIAKIVQIYESNDFSYRINGKNTTLIHLYDDQSENILSTYLKAQRAIREVKKAIPKEKILRIEQDNTKHLRILIKKAIINCSITFLFLTLLYLPFKGWQFFFLTIITLFINITLIVLLYSSLKIPIDIQVINSTPFVLSFLCLNIQISLNQKKHIGRNNILKMQFLISCIITAFFFGIDFLNNQNSMQLLSLLRVSMLASFIAVVTNAFFANSLYNLLNQKNKKSIITKNIDQPQKSLYKSLEKYRMYFLIIGTLLTGIPVFLIPQNIDGLTKYNRVLSSELFQENIIPISEKVVGGIWRLFHQNIYVNTNYEDSQETVLNIFAELPLGATPSQTEEALMYLERHLQNSKYIQTYISEVHSGQRGSIKIKFTNSTPTDFPEQLRRSLIDHSQNLGGVGWTFSGVGRAFSNRMLVEHPTFELKLTGYNYSKLTEIGESIRHDISENQRISSARFSTESNFNSYDSYEYKMTVDESQIARLGLEQENIRSEMLLNNSEISDEKLNLNIQNEKFPIKIREKNQTNLTISQFLSNPLKVDTHFVKPSILTKFSKTDRVESILRENRKYIRLLNLKYVGAMETGYSFLSEKMKEINKTLPEGYQVEILATAQSKKQTSTKFLIYFTLLLFVFAIISITLNSLKSAIIFLDIIFISFSGSFIFYYIGDFSFDQGGQSAFWYGFILNLLLLLSFREVRIENYNRIHFSQIYSILLPFLVIISGVIPYLITQYREPFWSSFAIGILGSSSAAVILSILVLPLFDRKSVL